MLRGNTPVGRLALALPGLPKKIATLLFGPWFVPEIIYEDCFLRDAGRLLLDYLHAHDYLDARVCLMGGISSLAQIEGALDEGFFMVQMARPLIREPDFINRIERELVLQRQQHDPHPPHSHPHPHPHPHPHHSHPHPHHQQHQQQNFGIERQQGKLLSTAAATISHDHNVGWDVRSKCIRCNLCVLASVKYVQLYIYIYIWFFLPAFKKKKN